MGANDFGPVMQAILSQPTPPCEHYRCELFDRCASDLLACDAFAYYVSTGRTIPPNSMFSKSRRLVRTAEPRPTRAQYMRIYREDSA